MRARYHRRVKLVACIALAACAHAPAPRPPDEPAPAPKITTVCAVYGYRALLPHGAASEDPAFDSAHADAARDDLAAQLATANNEHRKAARHYLHCAARFRSVAATSALRFAAAANAKICYANALVGFANAGALGSDGRRELERAAVDDPALADAIAKMLADAPSECTP